MISQQQIPLEELIYLCLPCKVGYLEELNCPSLDFRPESFDRPLSRESAIEALKYRKTLSWLGYPDLNIVCIPAHQIRVLPRFEQGKGFIKVAYETKRKCYLSGKRSAILIEGGRVLRLKGCGNMFDGFVYQKGSGLRGSHFFHTAKREMVMTAHIDAVLRKHGRKSANKSHSIVEYPAGFGKQLGQASHLRDELPLLSKYCCVFETMGERRLGTHLISPLQLLFQRTLSISCEQLQNAMKKSGRWDSDGATPTPTEWIFAEIKTQTDLFLDLYENKIANNSEPLNLLEETAIGLAKLPNSSLSAEKFVKAVKQLMVQTGISNLDTSQKGPVLIQSKIEKLATKENTAFLILVMVYRLGWEVGQVKRIFCQERINWGFFEDHNVTHCNAHLNNFVIKRTTSPGQALTYPLDFDLAFTKQEFVDIDTTSLQYGQSNPVQFQTLLEGEYKSLQLALSGLEIMNFKYGILDQTLQGAQLQRSRICGILFRDVLLAGFMEAMKGDQCRYEQQYQAYWQECRELTDLSLLISENFET